MSTRKNWGKSRDMIHFFCKSLINALRPMSKYSKISSRIVIAVKEIAIGESDFRNLIKDDNYFIDKKITKEQRY